MLDSNSLPSIPSSFTSAANNADSSFTDSIRNVVGGSTNQENDSIFPKMSYETRVKGFVFCFLFGFVISFLSSLLLWTGNVVGFVMMYTLGNLLSLFGSGFLVGPKKQCTNMWKPVRAVASAIYLLSLLATVLVAFLVGNATIVIVLMIVQFCAGIWYSASYIPYARTAIMSCCKTTIGE